MKENRLKMVRITEEELVSAFTRTSAPHYVEIRNRQLPEGYVVERVLYDWSRRQFDVMVSHPSFDEVPDGKYAPDIEGDRLWAIEVVQVDRKEPQDQTPDYILDALANVCEPHGHVIR